MSEEEKKAIEIVQGLKVYYDDECLLDEEELEENKTVNNAIDMVINLLENQQKELEHYKRLAEMNLKDSEEFKENMCEHRCILNNQIMELTEELNNLKEIEKSHQEENGKLRVELEQEKEKNKELETENFSLNEMKRYNKKHYISKDKIRNLAKNIKEQRNFYDKNEEAEWGQYNKYETYDYFYNKIKKLLEE